MTEEDMDALDGITMEDVRAVNKLVRRLEKALKTAEKNIAEGKHDKAIKALNELLSEHDSTGGMLQLSCANEIAEDLLEANPDTLKSLNFMQAKRRYYHDYIKDKEPFDEGELWILKNIRYAPDTYLYGLMAAILLEDKERYDNIVESIKRDGNIGVLEEIKNLVVYNLAKRYFKDI